MEKGLWCKIEDEIIEGISGKKEVVREWKEELKVLEMNQQQDIEKISKLRERIKIAEKSILLEEKMSVIVLYYNNIF